MTPNKNTTISRSKQAGSTLAKRSTPALKTLKTGAEEKTATSLKLSELSSSTRLRKPATAKKPSKPKKSGIRSEVGSTTARKPVIEDDPSLRNNQRRAVAILDTLEQVYTAEFEGLDFANPLQLLVATILSAQSTDKLVNTVTPKLFRKYLRAQDYVDVVTEELEEDIRSTGYFRSKARHIQGCCAMLVDRHGGQVPGTMDELLALPGVGRKTANCVLSQCFGQQGLTVDTHVNRISNLLGFVQTIDPVKIERALMDIVPHDRWNQFNELIITHGRKTCIARRPRCESCAIVDLCPSRRA